MDDLELETVFSTSDPDLIPILKSILDGADIPYVLDGEALMNLFPSQHLGPLLHRARGEVRFRVPVEHAPAARVLLQESTGEAAGEEEPV